MEVKYKTNHHEILIRPQLVDTTDQIRGLVDLLGRIRSYQNGKDHKIERREPQNQQQIR